MAPTSASGFQFEYAYRWFDVSDDLPIGATRFSASHQTHQLDFNLVVNLTPPESTIRGYVIAGPGAYYRKVEITEYVGSGVICDPYYYVCGTYPVEAVLGSRGGWDFGFNFGGGVGLAIGEEAEFFIESRFHYVLGPDIQPTATPWATATGGGARTATTSRSRSDSVSEPGRERAESVAAEDAPPSWHPGDYSQRPRTLEMTIVAL